ncbi:hypothetical protein MKX03_013803 [Papaver bracteatum]|nr:hypothetical protein MKX03_013803 [Papaver bracteatum]
MQQSGQTVSISLATATAAAVPGFSTTAATTPALSPVGGQVALPPCNWTEHSFPEGYNMGLQVLGYAESQVSANSGVPLLVFTRHEWAWKSKNII